jgi:hypothetical protein
MPFPANDKYWIETADFLKQHLKELEPLIAHQDFVDVFAGAYPYRCLPFVMDNIDFRWAVVHKGVLNEFSPDILKQIVQDFVPVFANEVFIVFSKDKSLAQLPFHNKHLISFGIKKGIPIMKIFAKGVSPKLFPNKKFDSYGIVINTYNRPHALERSLPQIAALNAPMLIVDDGSTPAYAETNVKLAKKYDTRYMFVPENRGLPCSMNLGVSYWLADPKTKWISILNDDVDVQPELFEVLSQIQDAKLRPLCTGHDDGEHPVCEQFEIAGHSVRMKRFCRGPHIHAHREYWSKIMPIPTPYLGAPKADRGIKGQGSDSDWWISACAPDSVVKRGMYVACVPDLVKVFLKKATESTWGGEYPKNKLDSK